MKPWTKEETGYLQENWGRVSVKALAKRLNKSVYSILNKKQRLGLSAFLDSGDYVTFNELIQALGRPKSNTYMSTSWIKNRGFPIKLKKVNNCSFRVVYLNDFWKWAEKNRNFIDFSKVPKNSLGKEPAWVKQQRKTDQRKTIKIHTTPWTLTEDQYLKIYLKQYRFTYDDLSRMLGRTCGAIQHRICDLKLKDRPVKVNNHIKWTKQELELLDWLIQQGTPYPLMAEQLHKSEKAIRGKVYIKYGSENLDKVRQKMKRPA